MTIECHHCKKQFERRNSLVSRYGKKHLCKNCDVVFTRKVSQAAKSKNLFCSLKCAATYNNRHKQTGVRRSRLEIFIEERLRSEFTSLQMLVNSKTVIGSELDFYFPTLKLAIEINGIFHYEPIYGHDKLRQIMQNDYQKEVACQKSGIELIVIPTLNEAKNSQDEYLEQVRTILKCKLRAGNLAVSGIEPEKCQS